MAAERTMATSTGIAASGGMTAMAGGALVATVVAGGLGLLAGLMFGMGLGEERGYMKGSIR